MFWKRKSCEETGIHDFQPRFDESMPDCDGMRYRGGDLDGFLDKLKSRRYVCDVCRRCGKVVDAREEVKAKCR